MTQEVCRACFSFNNLRNIFEICIENSVSLSDMLNECCSIKIDWNDGLSQKICLKCVQFLHFWSDYKKKCLKIQKIFINAKIKTVQENYNLVFNDENSKAGYNLLIKNSLSIEDIKIRNGNDKKRVKKYLKNNTLKKNTKSLLENMFINQKSKSEIQDLEVKLELDNDYKLEKNNDYEIEIAKNFERPLNKKLKENSIDEQFVENIDLPNKIVPEEDSNKINNIFDLIKNCGLKCLKCDSEFETNEKMRAHYYRSHIHNFECTKCNNVYKRKGSLKAHILTAHTTNKFKIPCPKCNKTFTHKNNRDRHMRTIHDKVKYPCKFCPNTYTQKPCWNYHMELAHQDKIENNYFLCPKCSKKFIGQTCSWCRRDENKYSSVNQKKRKPQKLVKKYKMCSVCNTNVPLTYFVTHMNKHNNIRPFKCSYCDKSFMHNQYLVIHEDIHRDIKRFSCSICFKPFRQRSHLREHERQHTGIKPYQCEVCQRQFSQKVNKDAHVRMHYGDKPYKCKLCTECFYDAGRLSKHVKKKH